MHYTGEQWRERHAARSDLSTQLTHLTKDGFAQGAVKDVIDVLLKILIERTLHGSTASGFICGSSPAVCFQDAPLYSIAQHLYYEQQERKKKEATGKTAKVRYTSNGLLFDKKNLFRKGARPVIYGSSTEWKKVLPNEQWWRIVDFDLSSDSAITDWTHEREWRLPGQLQFELGDVTVLVSDQTCYRRFVEKCRGVESRDILREIRGIVTMQGIVS